MFGRLRRLDRKALKAAENFIKAMRPSAEHPLTSLADPARVDRANVLKLSDEDKRKLIDHWL